MDIIVHPLDDQRAIKIEDIKLIMFQHILYNCLESSNVHSYSNYQTYISLYWHMTIIKSMSLQFINISVLLLFAINFIVTPKINGNEQRRTINTKSHFFHKSIAFMERSCDCMMGVSCNCCESVVMLFMQTTKRLCANFLYQWNGLTVDITLDSNTLRTMTVRNYRPFIMCTSIPGSLYSFVCLNVLELNNFPRSITTCVRLDIKTSAQEWKFNYRCISISTALPIIRNQTVDNQPPSTAISSRIILTTPAVAVTSSEQMQQSSVPSVTDTISRAHMRPNFTISL